MSRSTACRNCVLVPDVIPALLHLQTAGYTLVLVSNQDGLGHRALSHGGSFEEPQDSCVRLLASQGIHFAAEFFCPHLPARRVRLPQAEDRSAG